MDVVQLAVFAFAWGIGLASGLCGGLFWGGVICKEKDRHEAAVTQPAPETVQDSAAVRLARQYENMMNYDGTERGQLPLEE